MIRNPIFESSAKRRMRSYRAPMLVTLYVLFLLLVSFGALSILMRPAVTLGNLRIGLETYIYVSVMQFALIVLVAPALTATAISGERERQTLDLLLCTRVGGMRIALGKLLSSVCFLALMLASSLPVMAISLLFGGITVGDILLMELFLLVMAFGCCAIGLFCSAVFKRTVTATVVSYLAIFAIGFGTLIVPLLFERSNLNMLGDMINNLRYGSSVYYGGNQDVAQEVATMFPVMFYINPGIALLSLLIHQTGLLANTIQSLIGGYGTEVYQVLNLVGPVAWINMGMTAVISIILVILSGLFVKPSGRKVRKHK